MRALIALLLLLPLRVHAADAGTARAPRAKDAGVALDAGSAPDAGSSPDAGQVAVLVGAGDIATCDRNEDEQTAALLDALPGTVFTLGDNAYASGSPREFEECFAPTWGRHKARMRPALGNHDFYSPRAAPYFAYFGQTAGIAPNGYYSYRAGEWLVLVLNSVCDEVPGGCGKDSPQARWLRQELARNPTRCALAMWHHPLFSSGRHGSAPEVRPLFEILYELGADVVLNGHDHHYERFMPVDPHGRPDPARGIREFIVGTGGIPLRGFWSGPLEITERRDNTAHGVLQLTLRPDGYDWRFFPIPGAAFSDWGSGRCH